MIDTLIAIGPMIGKIAALIIEGIQEGKDAKQILRDLERADIVSDEAIAKVRSATKKVDDFLK